MGELFFLLVLLGTVFFLKYWVLPNDSGWRNARRNRRLRRYMTQEDFDREREHQMIHRGLTEAGIIREPPAPVSYEMEGPSAAFLEYYLYSHPNPTEAEQLDLVNLFLIQARYMEAEQHLRMFNPMVLNDEMRVVYHNERLYLYIITGRPEQAHREWENCQTFMESYFQSNWDGAVAYFDNAAVLHGLYGDAEKALQYCEMAEQWVKAYGVTDSQALFPMITRLKCLYLVGTPEEAEQYAQRVHTEIECFSNYAYPWQRSYMHNLLQEARCFALPDNDQSGSDTITMEEL